jgi:hypothetical protein
VAGRLMRNSSPWILRSANPRDERARLSGSRPDTHQHRVPAGATCCPSLLLDPYSMMTIDLHKWLFLLVTGRGE